MSCTNKNLNDNLMINNKDKYNTDFFIAGEERRQV